MSNANTMHRWKNISERIGTFNQIVVTNGEETKVIAPDLSFLHGHPKEESIWEIAHLLANAIAQALNEEQDDIEAPVPEETSHVTC